MALKVSGKVLNVRTLKNGWFRLDVYSPSGGLVGVLSKEPVKEGTSVNLDVRAKDPNMIFFAQSERVAAVESA